MFNLAAENLATEREMVFMVGSPVNCRLRPTGISLDAAAESLDPSRPRYRRRDLGRLGQPRLRWAFLSLSKTRIWKRSCRKGRSLELLDRGGVTGVILRVRPVPVLWAVFGFSQHGSRCGDSGRSRNQLQPYTDLGDSPAWPVTAPPQIWTCEQAIF